MKKIVKSTLVVATLAIAGYAWLIAYQSQKEQVLAMSDFLLLNVEALAQDAGDDLEKPKKQYVEVIKECGICCKIMPSGYPDRDNEKVKTGNTWQTCKRELMNDQNRDSSCSPQSCPSDEMPYTNP